MPTLEDLATEVNDVVGGLGAAVAFDTVKVRVEAAAWVESIATAKEELGLGYLSFVSAIDWANDVAIGDPPAETVVERYEMLCGVGDISEGRFVVFSADLDKDNPSIGSLTAVFPGAEWHEREAAEMFDITFEGLANTANIYLPDGFVGHPLQKSFALLAREVKPWPGDVDVEGLPGSEGDDEAGPSTENPEA